MRATPALMPAGPGRALAVTATLLCIVAVAAGQDATDPTPTETTGTEPAFDATIARDLDMNTAVLWAMVVIVIAIALMLWSARRS